MSARKIVIFGYTQLTKTGILALSSLGFELYFVCSEIYKSKFKELRCERLGQSLFCYNSIQDQSLESHIKAISPDYIFVFGLADIIPNSLISIPSIAAINTHPSLLPELKGPNPWYWAIYHNLPESGITLHQLSSEIDGGDIIAQIAFPIHSKDTRGILSQKVNGYLSKLISDIKTPLLEGTLDLSPQKGDGTLFKRPGTNQINLNFSRNAVDVDANIRANNPELPSRISLNSIVLDVREATITTIPATTPYEILVKDSRLYVSAKDVFLELTILDSPMEGIFTSTRFLDLCPVQSGTKCERLH
jgi:methionyl-tRNA formyltransferase